MSGLQERINRLIDQHGFVAVMEAVREVAAGWGRESGKCLKKERTLCHEVLCAYCKQDCPLAGRRVRRRAA